MNTKYNNIKFVVAVVTNQVLVLQP